MICRVHGAGKNRSFSQEILILKTVYEQVPVGLGLGQMESIERHWRRSISLEAKLSLVKKLQLVNST